MERNPTESWASTLQKSCEYPLSLRACMAIIATAVATTTTTNTTATALPLYCSTALLLYCSASLLLYCYTAILLYCYTAILLCCYTPPPPPPRPPPPTTTAAKTMPTTLRRRRQGRGMHFVPGWRGQAEGLTRKRLPGTWASLSRFTEFSLRILFQGYSFRLYANTDEDDAW